MQFREIPYLLRLAALIFVFNGLFALIHTLISPLSQEGFFLDPRILNIFIALGLMARKKFWYILGILSAGIIIFFHIASLIKLAPSGLYFVFYYLLGIAISLFQLYVLLSKNIRGLYFSDPTPTE